MMARTIYIQVIQPCEELPADWWIIIQVQRIEKTLQLQI